MTLSRTTHLKRSRRQNKSNSVITLHISIHISPKVKSTKCPIRSEREQVADFFSLKSSWEFMTMSHILKQYRCRCFLRNYKMQIHPNDCFQSSKVSMPRGKQSRSIKALPPLIMSIFSPTHGQQQPFVHSFNVAKHWQDCRNRQLSLCLQSCLLVLKSLKWLLWYVI